MYLIGYDIGSGYIKAALVHADSKLSVAYGQYPQNEMDIITQQRGWAEQHAEMWWQGLCKLTQRLLAKHDIDPKNIQGIGISYQMHGLVLVDQNQEVLRPSIIWCDSRAIAIGEQAYHSLGKEYCTRELLNAPGNFTASKLKWVKDNEPDVYEKIHKILLPGDYIAMKFSGEINTTISGLSEGIFWNFKEKNVDEQLLEHFGVEETLLGDIVPTFSQQATVSKRAALQTGLVEGTPITYRAGDQPNHALSLNVLHPGEVAAISDTSGVVYGIVDRPLADPKSRVNSFAHVNYEAAYNRIGVLLCLNGAGAQNTWIKQQIARHNHSYADMERMAASVPIGADGLCILPFGNGAERMLENKHLNANIFNLQFNRHSRGHLYRAGLEGVAFSFVYGIQILQELGLDVDIIRVSNDNMFQSPIFSNTIASLLNISIEMVDTNGAIGAAKAAGIAVGAYRSIEEALSNLKPVKVFEPKYDNGLCSQAFSYWKASLEKSIGQNKSIQQSPPTKTKRELRLEKELKEKNRELALLELRLLRMQNASAGIKSQLQTLLKEAKQLNPEDLKKLEEQLDQNHQQEEDWRSFEEHFNILHNDFFYKLRERFPQLSTEELKMCAFLKMGLSNKEMAHKLHLSVRGVETRRYRLGKKITANKHTRIQDILQTL